MSARYEEASVSSIVDRRYVIKREIARGGMGVVFEAEHKWTHTRIALKMLPESALALPVAHARLMREGRALSLVRHVGVVAILDAGLCDTHGPYVALELFDGRSLYSLVVARRYLAVADVSRIARHLGAVISHVHARGVLHRDIKAGNVLVGREPGRDGDVVKLLDFGIALVPGSEDVVDRKLTTSGEILGTSEYLAPELLMHSAGPSVASDVYSFGALLYECLTGDVPHSGPPLAIMTAMIQGVAPRPVRELRPDVPPEVEAAVLRALAPLPSARFGSAAALAAAVGAAAPAPGELTLMEPQRAGGETRRNFARAPYMALARLITSKGHHNGRVEDISEGGVLMVTDVACAQGDTVTLRLPLPRSGRVVSITAIARWVRERRGQYAVGVEFGELDANARADVQSYVTMIASGAAGHG